MCPDLWNPSHLPYSSEPKIDEQWCKVPHGLWICWWHNRDNQEDGASSAPNIILRQSKKVLWVKTCTVATKTRLKLRTSHSVENLLQWHEMTQSFLQSVSMEMTSDNQAITCALFSSLRTVWHMADEIFMGARLTQICKGDGKTRA